MRRRAFAAYLAGFVGLFAGPLLAQKAIMEKGKAVTCDSDSFKCGACGHDSCRTINSSMVVGNDNRNYPETAVLFDYRIVVCDNCGVLSGLKS